MRDSKVIGVREIETRLGNVSVVLTRNECGTVAGQCLLGDSERPIIDGATEQDVLETFKAVIEDLLIARSQRSKAQASMAKQQANRVGRNGR